MRGLFGDIQEPTAGLQCVSNRSDFDGDTYEAAKDAHRMGPALQRVFEVLSTGRAYTLHRLAQAAGCSVTGASARVRDLRKQRFGGWHVHSYRDPSDESGGVWLYRLIAQCHACGRDMHQVGGGIGNVTHDGKLWCGCDRRGLGGEAGQAEGQPPQQGT